MKRFYFIILLLTTLLSPVMVFSQGEVWGVTTAGGAGFGSLLSMPTGSTGFSFQRNFDGVAGAGAQHNKLLQASNGKIYGTLLSGGANNLGVLFEYDISTGIYTKKYDFSSATGSSPRGPLMQASNGKLYGMTQGGGTNNVGVLYEYDISTGTYTVKVDMVTANGSQPFGGLTELSTTNGKLYGMTRLGGANSGGVIFEYDLTSGSYTKKIDMSAATGTLAFGDLVQAGTMLYGLASSGGTASAGTLFEYDYTNNVCTKKIDLLAATGSAPNGSLYKASNGNLYGMTTAGGANNSGVIFQYSVSTNAYTAIHNFTSSSGGAPSGNVIQGNNGKLYGLAKTGGATANGVLFEYDLVGSAYTKLFDLQSNTTIGGNPFGTLLQASNGKFYGLTNSGGIVGVGVLFEYDLSTTTYTKKIDLNFAPDGGIPNGGLVYASNGKLYGTAISGGTNNVGAIFEYNKTTSTFAKKVDMSTTNGSVPYGSMMEASNGKLYGLTNAGGANGLGVIYEYDFGANTYTKKIDLSSTVGSQPFGNMVQAGNGKLYGCTRAGGTNGLGVIFEYVPGTNTYTKKIDLASANGSQPSGSLVEALNGKLYGLTQTGGTNALGVIFEYDPSTNTYVKKIDLSTTLGSQPLGSLVLANDGNLYGMTRLGGSNSLGTVIKYDYVNNICTKMADLSGALGSSPQGSFIKTASGKLYGFSQTGGANGLGTLLEYDVTNTALTNLVDLNLTSGCTPGYTRLVEICPTLGAPGLISSSTNTLCQGLATIQTFTAAPVGGALSYTWTLPAGASVTGGATNSASVDLSGVAAGTYSFGVRAVNACGPGPFSTDNFTVFPKPTITVNSATICSGTSVAITPTAAGITAFSITGGAFTVTPAANSSYSITGTSTAGCLASNTAVSTVSVKTSPTITVNSATICSGTSVVITPTAAGITAFNITGGAFTVTPLSNSSYSVTGTGTNGCPASNTAVSTVSVKTTPTITVNNPTICSGTSVAITPTAAGISVFNITGGAFTVTPPANSSYSVTGTGTNGCIASNTAVSTVSVKTTPTITVNSATICSGATVVITPTAAGVNVFNVTGGNFTVTPVTNTNYSVTGTGTNGCVANTAVSSVSVKATPTITVNSATICTGASVAITPTAAVVTVFTITGGAFTVTPAANNTYSVTGTGTNGCIASNTAVSSISVNTIPTITVNSATICSGASVVITPTGATAYNVTGGNFTVFPITNTNYSVTGTTNGCTSSSVVASVSVNTSPTITVNSATICSGNSVAITPTAAGINVFNITGGNYTVTPLNNSSFSVTGTGTNGCISSNTAVSTVSVKTTPAITVNNATICSGQSVAITPTAAGISVFNITGGSFIVTPATNSFYSVTGTGVNGCIASNTAISTVSVKTTPILTVNSATICSGNSVAITPTAAGVGTYTISGGGNFTVSPGFTAYYFVSGTSTNGCVSNTAVATVSVNTTPTVHVNNFTICAGNTVVIMPTGANTYTVTGGTLTVTPATTTSYSITGSNTTGCVANNTAVCSVSVNALPTLSVNSAQICKGATFTIVPTGAVTYSITGGNFNVSPTTTTTYSVTGVDLNGCPANPAICTVTVNALPVLTASAVSGTVCVGETATLSVGGAATFTWNTSQTGPVIIVTPTSASTTYTVIGTDINNCVDTTTVTQKASPCTGLMGNSQTNHFVSIFPNPTNGFFTARFEFEGRKEITVYDETGRAIEIRVTEAISENIDLARYAKGVYLVRVNSEAISANFRILVQ